MLLPELLNELSKRILVITMLVTLLVVFSSSSYQRYTFGSSSSPSAISNAPSGRVVSTANKGGTAAIEKKTLSSVQAGNLLIVGITIEDATILSVTDNQ